MCHSTTLHPYTTVYIHVCDVCYIQMVSYCLDVFLLLALSVSSEKSIMNVHASQIQGIQMKKLLVYSFMVRRGVVCVVFITCSYCNVLLVFGFFSTESLFALINTREQQLRPHVQSEHIIYYSFNKLHMRDGK